MTDYLQATNYVKETMEKAGCEPTEDQFAVLSGALFVWFDHFYKQGRRDGESLVVDGSECNSGV